MWNKLVGLIIFLRLACVITRGDDEMKDSRTSSVDLLIEKEYELILIEATWYTANQFCKDKQMRLASIHSLEEQHQLESLIKDNYNRNDQFWVSSSLLAHKEAIKWSKSLPSFTKWNPNNQCTFWYWYKVELCATLRPLASEWKYDSCGKNKYFICETEGNVVLDEKVMELIREELVNLIDEMMVSGFAEALTTATEDTLVDLVINALNMWLEEQKILKPATLLDEHVNSLADEVIKTKKELENDELRELVNNKFDMLQLDQKMELLNERFRQILGDEYTKLENLGAMNSADSTSYIIDLLVDKVIRLVEQGKKDKLLEEMYNYAEVKPSATLAEEHLYIIAQKLTTLSEEEFKTYVLDAIEQFEEWGVQEFDMDILLQLFLLAKQELFSIMAKTSIKMTSQERIDIASYGVSRILSGNVLKITAERSVLGQIFVVLATGLGVLSSEKFVNLNDELLREFVKNEFEGLRYKDMVDLKYDGYMKFVVDEFIKLGSSTDPSTIEKNESGELLLDNIISLIASQLFWFVDDEMKMMADRLSKSRLEKSNEHALRIMTESMNRVFYAHEEENLLYFFQLVEQELLKITAKSLVNFTEEEMIELVEKRLLTLLTGDILKLIEERSVFWKVFLSLLEQFTREQLEYIKDDELHEFVKSEFEKSKNEGSVELFEEALWKLVIDEFIKLNREGLATLAAQEEGKNLFGEMVKLLAGKLFVAAGKEENYFL